MMGCMLNRWNLKVSFSTGLFKYPLFRQYQRAMSVLTWVDTNWDKPHILAIVLVFLSLYNKC